MKTMKFLSFPKSFYQFFLIVLVAMLALTSCRGKEELGSEGGSKTGNAADDSDDPGTIDATVFSVVTQADKKYTYFTHKGTGLSTDNWDEPCQVLPTDTNKDITCVVEAHELDIFFFGIGLRVNVPPSMCSFLVQRRPYFYQYLPGIGGGTAVDNTAGTVTNSGVAAGANTLTCAFDYTASKGPNCCEGNYTKIVYSSTNVPTATPNQSWGGKAANCLAGPAVDLSPKSISGYPLGVIDFVEGVGYNNGYFMAAPIQSNLISNIKVTNFFKPAEHVPTRPLMTTAAGFISTQLYHEFDCLDRAREVQATIKVMIREWNSVAELAKKAAGDPDASGVEAGYGTPINDYDDVKDLGENYPRTGL